MSDPLAGSPYVAYLYGYPHKTAYRQLAPPVRLRDAWAGEDKRALFLYLHVPFCEMRCGFCNLFTAAVPREEVVGRYLDALEREAAVVRGELGRAAFARAAVGGGTPTYLEPAQLERLFDIAALLGANLETIPLSVEVSPETVDAARLDVLERRGADRISIGVQSFFEAETAALKRPQQRATVARALDAIRARDFSTLNIDLIYGIEGQTAGSFRESIAAALTWEPEELYLYPLYVRPLTLLGRTQRAWDDGRTALYRAGRELLLERGYQQVSMRNFRRPGPAAPALPYRCQQDGMVGLGCGARSYTRRLHYSWDYAVEPRAVRGIIEAYSARSDASFAHAHHGFRLDPAEERRRYVILSVLADGLDLGAYRERFGGEPLDEFPQLLELQARALARREGEALRLTASGVERSDAIGPWLHSPRVAELMQSYEAR